MFFLRLLSRLPFWALYRFSDFLFFISYHVIRYRRTLVQKNLKNSFPERSQSELHEIELNFYKNLCDYAVETLKSISMRSEDFKKNIVFKNAEIVKNQLKQNQSVIFLTSHQFNWEWLLQGACLEYQVAMDFIYQPVGSKFFNKFSLEARTKFGAFPIERRAVAKQSVRRRNILRGIAMLADQYPGYASDKKYETIFMNQETVFFYGVNQITQLTQYPAYYHIIKRKGRGVYEATAVEIAIPPYTKDSNEVIEKYIKAVEKNIQENPSNWLWSHDRWKNRHLKQA